MKIFSVIFVKIFINSSYFFKQIWTEIFLTKILKNFEGKEYTEQFSKRRMGKKIGNFIKCLNLH